MSAQQVEQRLGADTGDLTAAEPVAAPSALEVRRNAAVAAVVGLAASATAIAYLWRASQAGQPLDWALCAGLAVLAAAYFVGLLDARTPLLVADGLGVRIRLGQQWRGLPWEAVDRMVVRPRRGLLRDGRVVVGLDDLARVLEGLDGRARRQVRLNQRLYGGALAVPLGISTRVVAEGEGSVADRLAALAGGRAEVLTLVRGRPRPETAAADGIGDGIDDDIEEEPPVAPAVPLRERDPGVGPEDRAEEAHVVLLGELPASPRVLPIAKLAEPVEPLVVDDVGTRPAYDPVIGPELAAARRRVGLTVDELADRTRIRPHVIESVEVDDFAPCGGDFYARGHIRTLARVLGKDAEPLLRLFEQRYAQAPVSARRVFEAELATGMTGSMRSTSGGASWSLLVGVVLSLALLWSVVRLFGGDDRDLVEHPSPVLNGALVDGSAVLGGPASGGPAVPVVRPLETTLVARNAATRVRVQDGDGTAVFDDTLALGQRLTLRVRPPVTVTAENGGAVTVATAGRERGVVGSPDVRASRTFGEVP